MSRIEESYEMVDSILGGIKYKKIKEGEESIDNILKEEDEETGPGGHVRDGSGPPEHGQGNGSGEGKEECNEEESAYQKYFKSKLEKYGVESPNDLDEEGKKEFFDDVDAGWKGKKE